MRCRRPCGQGCASRRPRWAERAWRSGSGSSGSGSGSGSGSSSGSSSSSGSRSGGGGGGSSSSSSSSSGGGRRRRRSSSSSWLLLVLLQRSPRGLAPVRRLAHVKDQGESICVQTPSSGKNRHGAWSINNDNGNAIHTDGPGTRAQLPRSRTKPLPERGPHLCAPRPSSHNATTDGDAHQLMHKSPQACDIGIFLIRASINPKARTAQLASQPLGWTASVAPLCWTAWAPHEGTLTCSTR